MITCYFENGKKVNLRHVVVDALIIHKDKILLVKRAPHLIEGGKYGIPGGFLERDETAEEGMKREIEEETGYEVTSQTLFEIITNPDRNEDRQNVSFVFSVQVGEQIKEHDDEVTEIRWFPLNALPSTTTIAFDHYHIIQSYLKNHLKPLPILA